MIQRAPLSECPQTGTQTETMAGHHKVGSRTTAALRDRGHATEAEGRQHFGAGQRNHQRKTPCWRSPGRSV